MLSLSAYSDRHIAAFGGRSPRETILKIQELKRLIYKYSQYHRNPGAVLSCIVYYCNNGDNTLLDEKLEQLRTFDSAMGYTRM
jgi:hypothetical protein